MDQKKPTIGYSLLYLVLLLAIFFIYPIVLMYTWNWTMPGLWPAAPRLDLVHSLGLVIIAWILFK